MRCDLIHTATCSRIVRVCPVSAFESHLRVKQFYSQKLFHRCAAAVAVAVAVTLPFGSRHPPCSCLPRVPSVAAESTSVVCPVLSQ